MQSAARAEGVVLQLVSVFRTVDRQSRIIRRKLARGESIDRILKVLAAPGYSEHHAGRAFDLTSPEVEPLSGAFENTGAFQWLQSNAYRFGFSLSYPRDNRSGVMYEPWHWAFTDGRHDITA